MDKINSHGDRAGGKKSIEEQYAADAKVNGTEPDAGRAIVDPRDPQIFPVDAGLEKTQIGTGDNFQNTRDPQEIADDNYSQYTTGRPV